MDSLGLDEFTDELFCRDFSAKFGRFVVPPPLMAHKEVDLDKLLLMVFSKQLEHNMLGYVVWQLIDAENKTIEVSSQKQGQPVPLVAKYENKCIVCLWSGTNKDICPLVDRALAEYSMGESKLFRDFSTVEEAIKFVGVFLKSFHSNPEDKHKLIYVSKAMSDRIGEDQEFAELSLEYLDVEAHNNH